MNFFKKTQGAISIFLCIVMLALIALTGALVDGARMRVAESESRSAVDASATSQLTEYNNTLKELYGMFAMADNDPATIREALQKGLGENLFEGLGNADKEGFDKYYSQFMDFFNKNKAKPLNLFDYKIEDIKVNPLYNLSEPEIAKQQILEFMKYRAPKEIADNFLDKLYAFKDIGEQSKILEKKLDIDEKLDSAGQNTEVLSDKAFDINSLTKNNNIIDRLNDISAKIAERVRQQNLLEDKKKQLSKMTPPQKPASDDEEAQKDYKERLDSFNKSIENLKKDINNIENKLIPDLKNSAIKMKEDLVNYINKDLADNEAFESAKKAISDIKGKSVEVVDMANKLSSDIASDSSSFAESMRTDLKSKKQGIDTKVLDDRIAEIDSNRNKYIEISEIINKIDTNAIGQDLSGVITSSLDGRIKSSLSINAIQSLINNIPRVNYYVKKRQEAAKEADDPRASIGDMKKDIEEAGNKQLEEIKKSDESNKDKYPKDGLPSQGGVEDSANKIKDLLESDLKFLSDLKKVSVSNTSGFNPDYEGASNDENLDFKSGTGSSKKALSIINGLSDIISSGLKNMRDELYIDEYAMGMFKNAVTKNLDSKGDIQYDLTGYKMSTRDNTFFDTAELEYILHGSGSQSTNIMWIKGQILLVRWALNSISIYCDPKKVSIALEMATAIAGWTVFGVPLVQTLILLAWSFAESMIDVYMIMQGEDMPIFKMNSDWTLSIEGGAKGTAKALAKKMTESFKSKAIEETKKLIKSKANEVIDYTSDQVAEGIDKGITGEITKVTGGISDTLIKSIDQKVEEVLDSAFKPFENAIFTEIGKTEAKFDDLKDSLDAAKQDVSEDYEQGVDDVMVYVNEAIYNSVKEYFPEAETELKKAGYSAMIEDLREQERKYFEDLKNIGTDFLGKKEKELKDKLDQAEEQTIGKIKTAIKDAKENLKKKVISKIDNTLGVKLDAAGKNLSEKLNNIVSKKIQSIKNTGKDKIKSKLGDFIDKIGGKSKGSTLKGKTSDEMNFTVKTNIKGNLLKMGYSGYLRLFLLFTSPDKKLKRIQDLIQLNMSKETGKDFKLSDYNTYLRVEAVVSVKYFFMTSAFMPRKFKGRYKISHIVYKGY
ncbi:MAG: DUF5702 domain-containing protein [Bacillota bacterium]|nr:DUF5702 domain-containing protein [Bacillota bacterium]